MPISLPYAVTNKRAHLQQERAHSNTLGDPLFSSYAAANVHAPTQHSRAHTHGHEHMYTHTHHDLKLEREVCFL